MLLSTQHAFIKCPIFFYFPVTLLFLSSSKIYIFLKTTFKSCNYFRFDVIVLILLHRWFFFPSPPYFLTQHPHLSKNCFQFISQLPVHFCLFRIFISLMITYNIFYPHSFNFLDPTILSSSCFDPQIVAFCFFQYD